MTRNAEFMADPRRVALANAITVELRAAGDKTVGAVFLDTVASEVDKALGARRGGVTRVASGAGSARREAGGGGGVTKTYADLPAEAKAACDSMSKRLVGPNRKHKDEASWRASYTKQYFSSGE